MVRVDRWQFFLLLAGPLLCFCQPASGQDKSLEELKEALSSEDLWARQAALRSLKEHGVSGAPLLVEALADSEFGNRDLASRSLRELGPSALPALIKGLDHKQALVRKETARILGSLEERAEKAVPRLLTLLADDEVAVRLEVVAALGRIPGSAESVVPALLERLDDRESKVRGQAALALGRIGARPELVVPALRKAFKENQKSRSRSDFVRGLGGFGEETTPELLAFLEEAANPADVRAAAAEALGDARAKSAVPALVKVFTEESGWLRLAAMVAVGEIAAEPALAIPALIKALEESEDYNVQYRATQALGMFGEEAKSALPALEKARARRTIAREALSAIKQIKAAIRLGELTKTGLEVAGFDELRSELLSSKDKVRLAALNKLLCQKGGPALVWLILKEQLVSVRIPAVEEMLKEGGEKRLPALMDSLSHDSAEVRGFAAACLEISGAQAKGAAPGLLRLLADAEVRVYAVSALGAIKAESAVPELLRLLADKDSGVRGEAALALGRIGAQPGVVIPALRKALDAEGPGRPPLRDNIPLGAGRRDKAFSVLHEVILGKSIDRPADRVSIVRGLGAFGDKATPTLIEILDISSMPSPVRCAAIQELEALGPKAKGALPALSKASKDKDPLLAESARNAIKRIERALEKPEKR